MSKLDSLQNKLDMWQRICTMYGTNNLTLTPSDVVQLRQEVAVLYARIAELEKALNIDTDLTIAGLRKELRDATARIAELEAERRWVPVSERLPEEEGWYYAGVLGRFGDHYTHDVYFYAEDAAFRWKDCEGDKVYCWLDGVPELPKPPEVK